MIVELSEPARRELEHARDRYEAEREGLGDEFVAEMERLIADVGERPLTFSTIGRTKARRALAARFPYKLVFFLLGDVVRVVCVAHQHQAPDYWKHRL
jgi:plasmid stabilization system protein ParE